MKHGLSRPPLEYGSGFPTLLRKEVLRFYKVGFQTVAAPVLTAVLYLMIFGHVLEGKEIYGRLSYTAFLIPGLVMMTVLQNAFSNFLINALNMILNVNIRELNPEQIRDLLERNRPVLQQISDILIDEASQLLVGLSDVCKKVATDWMQNVVPGLVKSAAIGIPSAIEAAIPPLGEVVDIVTTGMAVMGGFMKLVDGVQRNYDTISQGFSQVQDAYDSLQEVKDLLIQQPAEIVKNATSAVITPRADDIARQVVQRALPGDTAAAAGGGRRGGLKRMKSRRKYLKDPKQFKTYISKIRNKTAKKEVELINSIRELKNM